MPLITGVHLVLTERDGFSKSAVPGALAAPTALTIVAGATLALPAELQKASALVPALKSNWQGLTHVHFSAHLEPSLTQKNTLHTMNTPLTRATQSLRAPLIP